MRRIFSLLVQADLSRLPLKMSRSDILRAIASVFNRCRHSGTAAEYPPMRSYRCSIGAGTAALPREVFPFICTSSFRAGSYAYSEQCSTIRTDVWNRNSYRDGFLSLPKKQECRSAIPASFENVLQTYCRPAEKTLIETVRSDTRFQLSDRRLASVRLHFFQPSYIFPTAEPLHR